MKYLLRYNEVRTNDQFLQEEISRWINWDLIELVKDLSLEFLDDGYTTGLEITYLVDDDGFDVEYSIYEIDYEHDSNDDGTWSMGSINKVLSDFINQHQECKFIYTLMVYKMELDIPYKVTDLDKSTMYEFISRLKKSFPDETIRINSAAMYQE